MIIFALQQKKLTKIRFTIIKNTNLIAFILLIILSTQGIAQINPGNVGAANITAWFNPDGLALGNVTSWTTTLPAGALTVTDATAPFPQATNTPIGNISNYNTTIEFAVNSNTNMQALENASSLNLLDNAFTGDQGTFFGVYYLPVTSPGQHMMQYNESFDDAIQLRNLGGISRIAISRGISASPNATRNWIEPTIPTIISYRGNRSSATSMEAFDRDAEITLSGPSQASGTVGLFFGRRPSQANSFFNGYLSEFIFYNRDLSLIEMDKVHTYLAIKYGITLQNIGGGTQGDYTATDGTLIWDADLAPNYHNDVIGIGRDDTEGLLQKQSHTFDDSTRIYLNTLAINNVSNIGTFNNDISYVTIGDNSISACDVICTNSGLGNCNINSHLAKAWKVTKNNFSQSFNLDLTLCNSSIIAATDLRLLIDDDGDFTNGGTSCYLNGDGTGLVISSTGSVLTLSDISNTHILDNSTAYFTIGFVGDTSVYLGNDTLLCQGDSLLLDATTLNATYLWQDNSTDSIFNVTQQGVYSVQATVNNCPIVDTIIVNYSSLQSININNDTTICFGDTANLFITPNDPSFSYIWDEPSNLNFSNINNPNVSPIDTTQYNVTITDTNGCIAFDSTTVFINPDLSASFSSITNLLCNSICDGQITVAPIGGTAPYNYNWSSSDTLATAQNLCAGFYSVIISDSIGCAITKDTTLTEPTPLQLSLTTSNNPLCAGGCNGDITVNTSGGIPNYQFSIDSAVTFTSNPFFNSLCANNYSLITRDTNNCMDTLVVTLIDPSSIIIDSIVSTDVNCNLLNIGNHSNGIIQIYTQGGTLPLTYSIDSGLTFSTSPNFNGLTIGNYPTIVTDSNGCTVSGGTININEPTAISIPNVVTDASCFGFSDGSILLTPLGGTPSYSYTWSIAGIGNNFQASSLAAGSVTVNVTDNKGCSQDSLLMINQFDSIDYISFSANDTAGCSPFDVSFTNTSNPALVTSSLWDFGNDDIGGSNPDNTSYNASGSYNITLTITDLNGCTASLEKTDYITVFEDPVAQFTTQENTASIFDPVYTFLDQSYSNIVGWNWDFNGLGTSTQQFPSFKFPELIVKRYPVSLIVENINGCKDTIIEEVQVNGDFRIYVPNTFTPNFDRLNDGFSPKGVGIESENYLFTIFNRWGEKIFETNSIDQTWNGYYENELVPSGVYHWSLKYVDVFGESHSDIGHVKILR